MSRCSLKRRKNDRQYIWEYMRRNRIFAVEELLPLVEMSVANMMLFFGQLERAGYIAVRIPLGKKSKPKKFTSRAYVFKKNTGVLVPVWIAKQNRLYDRNMREVQVSNFTMPAIEISKNICQVCPIDSVEYDKDRIRQILRANIEGLGLLALSERCGIGNSARFASTLHALKSDGEVKEVGSSNGVPILKLEEMEDV